MIILVTVNLLFANAFDLVMSKALSFGKELTLPTDKAFDI